MPRSLTPQQFYSKYGVSNNPTQSLSVDPAKFLQPFPDITPDFFSGVTYFIGLLDKAMGWTIPTTVTSGGVPTVLNDAQSLLRGFTLTGIDGATPESFVSQLVTSMGGSGAELSDVQAIFNQIVANQNAMQAQVQSFGTMIDKLFGGTGITVNVYVTDTGNVGVYELSGLNQSTVPFTGLSNPLGVAVDASGNHYVVDGGSNAVYKIAPNGTQTVLMSGLVTPSGGICVDVWGNVYVVDSGANSVYKIPAYVGSPSVLSLSNLSNPYGIAVDWIGNLYISNSSPAAVYKLSVFTDAQTTLAFTGLTAPKGVCVDNNGTVYVVDGTHAYELNLLGTQTTLPFSGLSVPRNIAVDSLGFLYLTDAGTAHVYQLSSSGIQTRLGFSGLATPIGLAIQNNLFLAASNANANSGNSLSTLLTDGENALNSLFPGVFNNNDGTASPAASSAIVENNDGTAFYNSVLDSIYRLFDNFDGTLTSHATTVQNIGSGAGQPGTTSNDLLSHLTAVSAAAGTPGATPVSAANAGVQLITNTLSGIAAALQSLTTQSTGAGNSGQTMFIDFSSYPTWSAVPVNTTYGTIPGQIGSHGSGQFIIDSNGNAAWHEVSNGDVSAISIFNGNGGQAFTNTDYQKLSASLAGLPNGAGSRNYAVERANAIINPSDYVYGVVYLSPAYQLDWELGCYIGGVRHIWGTGIDSTINLNFTMIAGVGNNPDRYQGYSGNTLVFDHINTSGDPGGVFPVNSSHRYWGFRSDTFNNGQITPAPASFVGIADNQPPAVPGSGIRMYRTNTASQSIGTAMGAQAIPLNTFFDAISENSPDLQQITTNIGSAFGTTETVLQVANAGRFITGLRADVYAATASSGAVTICPMIIRCNSAGVIQEERLLPGPGFFVNGVGGQYITGHIGGTGVIACEAGDLLIPALHLSGGPISAATGALSALSLTGESTGMHTYFEVTLANWSFN